MLLASCAALLWTGPVDAQPAAVPPKGGLPKCQARLDPGDGVNGRALSYTDDGNGTFTDNNTRLMWEEKTGTVGVAPGSPDVHDVNNNYSWSSTGSAADGTVFTDFLATLNTPPCFANHCDWRLPNITELLRLVDYGQFNPAIAPSLPGATQSLFYWSATAYAGDPGDAWVAYLRTGDSALGPKTSSSLVYARAVRSGL